MVSSAHEALSAAASLSTLVPVFLVSSVTGRGLPLLKHFLHVLPPRMAPKVAMQQVGVFFLCDFIYFHLFFVVSVMVLLFMGVVFTTGQHFF